MARARDIYGPSDGPRKITLNLETLLVAVREIYPDASFEGSTGLMLTFWVQGVAVGSAWQLKNETWAYRINLK
jgi:hypothetical protein